jgi:uncharacterized peroxidase-related enzyme
LVKDDEWVARFREDPTGSTRDDRTGAMVRHAIKLSLAPASIRAADVDALREAGLDDRSILDLTLVVAYFNFVNRLADGLGVPLEDEE